LPVAFLACALGATVARPIEDADAAAMRLFHPLADQRNVAAKLVLAGFWPRATEFWLEAQILPG
jgi:hypothetical protein